MEPIKRNGDGATSKTKRIAPRPSYKRFVSKVAEERYVEACMGTGTGRGFVNEFGFEFLEECLR